MNLADMPVPADNHPANGGYSITIGGIAIRPWEIISLGYIPITDGRGNPSPDVILAIGLKGVRVMITEAAAQANGYADIYTLRSQLAKLITTNPTWAD